MYKLQYKTIHITLFNSKIQLHIEKQCICIYQPKSNIKNNKNFV